MGRPDSDAKAREERNNAAGDGDEWERWAEVGPYDEHFH